MSDESVVVVLSLAIGSGGVTVGYLIATIMLLLRRIVDDLDAQRAREEAEAAAVRRLSTNLGRHRGRRTQVGQQPTR